MIIIIHLPRPGSLDILGAAISVGTATVRVEVLVDVQQELFISTGRVGDLDDGIIGPVDPTRSVSPFLAIEREGRTGCQFRLLGSGCAARNRKRTYPGNKMYWEEAPACLIASTEACNVLANVPMLGIS